MRLVIISPEHLRGFAAIWSMDPDVQREKIDVANFFRVNKMSAEIAAHFISAGYDTVRRKVPGSIPARGVFISIRLRR